MFRLHLLHSLENDPSSRSSRSSLRCCLCPGRAGWCPSLPWEGEAIQRVGLSGWSISLLSSCNVYGLPVREFEESRCLFFTLKSLLERSKIILSQADAATRASFVAVLQANQNKPESQVRTFHLPHPVHCYLRQVIFSSSGECSC